MRYTQFRIRNFKGISDATLNLKPAGGNIFTLIGLNESGKSSVLEAINAFRPDEDQQNLIKSGLSAYSYSSYIPKQYQSNFSDKIYISTIVEFSSEEIRNLLKIVEEKHECKILDSTINNPMNIVRNIKYEDSEFSESMFTLALFPHVKKKNQRKYSLVSPGDKIWHDLSGVILSNLPKLLYFPTFLFSIPDRIVLNPIGREDKTNSVYRRIIEDVGAQLPNKINVQKHIVERMIGKVGGDAKTDTGVVIVGHEKQLKAESALNDISNNISNTVFGEWKKVLGVNVKGREISLRAGIELSTDDKAILFVRFMMKDGSNYYDISERSLGFRWFFSFLLFTIYRSSSIDRGSTVFLLDEPASNLHAKAQMQLLESFPKIASGENALIYSTHSHYMVNPRWLEQASIISNSAIDHGELEDDVGLIASNPTNITITKYRRFVGDRPDKITYFQPVLDQLEYAPSQLELRRPTMLVEGKGDFTILEAVRQNILKDKSELSIVSTRGATGMDELIGLFLGWGIPFCICLDADAEGKKAKNRYIKEWGQSERNIFTLEDVDSSLSGGTIENLLDPEDLDEIKSSYEMSENPNKDQIRLWYSELLSSGRHFKCSDKLLGRVRVLIERANLSLS